MLPESDSSSVLVEGGKLKHTKIWQWFFFRTSGKCSREIQYWTLNICCFQETQPSQAGEILRGVFKEIPYIHSDWIYNQWLLAELPEESWEKTWALPALRNVLWCLWRHGLLGEPPVHTPGLGKERKQSPASSSSDGAIGRDSKEGISTYTLLTCDVLKRMTFL